MPEADADYYSGDELNNEGLPRRAFVKIGMGAIGAGYAGTIGYAIYAYLSTRALRVAEASVVTQTALDGAVKLPVVSGMMFMFGVKPALFILHKDGSWVAL